MFRRANVLALFLAFWIIFLLPKSSNANSTIRNNWLTTYPNACQLLIDVANDCSLCHEASFMLNGYGQDLANNGSDFIAIESFDSDSDGIINIDEINSCSHPGDPNNFITIEPLILQVVDVDNDQGRQVRVSWQRSLYDSPNFMVNVTGYAIFRREDDLTSSSNLKSNGLSNDGCQSFPQIEGWDFLITVPAFNDDIYQFVAPTLCDSTGAGGICWSVFFIRAIAAEPYIYFDSLPDSGYSVDNLEPMVPQGFLVTYGYGVNYLSWLQNEDLDFQCYKIYRSMSSNFEPSPDTFIHSTVATEWTDNSGSFNDYYLITATDFADNESDPAIPETITGSAGDYGPHKMILHNNVPNPFNPSTSIKFDLPVKQHVQLIVYSVDGKHIAVLIDEAMSSGHHSVTWTGQDDSGHNVASGSYIYRLEAGDYSATRRMVLIR